MSALEMLMELDLSDDDHDCVNVMFADLFNKSPQLQNRGLVDARDDQGRTALHIVCGNRPATLELVDELLSIGVDPDVCTNSGWNALHYICCTSYGTFDQPDGSEIVASLLDAGIQIDSTTDNLDTALKLACDYMRSGEEEALDSIVEALLARDANVNIANIDGITPLRIATAHGDVTLVLELRRLGASVTARTTGTQTLYNNDLLLLDYHYGREVKIGATPVDLANTDGILDACLNVVESS